LTRAGSGAVMRTLMTTRRHLAGRCGLLAAVLTLAIAGVAVAAFKSGTYKGHLTGRNSRIAITLKLSHTKVSGVSIDGLPFYCQGGAGPETIRFANVKISKTGTFTTNAVVKYTTGPYKGQVGQKFTIKGRFKSHGKATGTIKVTFVSNASCSGSEGWTAVA